MGKLRFRRPHRRGRTNPLSRGAMRAMAWISGARSAAAVPRRAVTARRPGLAAKRKSSDETQPATDGRGLLSPGTSAYSTTAPTSGATWNPQSFNAPSSERSESARRVRR